MSTPSVNAHQPLTELVAYLFARREAILTQWRSACEQDPTLSKVTALSREEFNNLLPIVLDILEERLLNKPPEVDPAITAQAHGLHRWHKAHGLMDTVNELHHLTHTLYSELDLFQRSCPPLESTLLLQAQRNISQVMQETISGSIQKYDELQRLQATSRFTSLQQALSQMQKLSQQQGNLLRTSAHDLKSSFGIANSAAYVLKTQELSAGEREEFIDILSRNLTQVEGLLTGLTDLARLEAGQEELQLESVDVAQLLRDTAASAQSMAAKRGVKLWADGAASLVVETDRIKLQRMVQNLLMNALKYTTPTSERIAIISVSWSLEGDCRWMFSIQDSGAGLPTTSVGTLAEQLRPTVEPTSVMGPEEAEPVAVLPTHLPQIPAPAELDSFAQSTQGGEGVSLLIVKRLCELLDGNLDVETKEGRGTLYRIRLPMHTTSQDC